ncbi:MAG: hypothetical protein ACRD59_00805 [Candidatus Acidiferrales bacterium]
MPLSAKLQESNLTFFLTAAVLPEIEASVAGAGAFERSFRVQAEASRFECVAWLGLGVELGYFDRASCDGLLQRYYHELIPTEESALQTLRGQFPDLPELLESVRSSKSLNLGRSGRFKAPDRLLSAFRSNHLVATTWAQDGLAKSFSIALNFSPDSTWDRITKIRSVDTEQILLAFNIGKRTAYSIATETIFAGYLRTLEHLASSRDIFRDLAVAGIDEGDFLEFKRSCRSIQFWRVDLKERLGRFRELSESVAKGLERDANTQQLRLETGFYWDELESLLEHWLEDGSRLPRIRKAGAS